MGTPVCRSGTAASLFSAPGSNLTAAGHRREDPFPGFKAGITLVKKAASTPTVQPDRCPALFHRGSHTASCSAPSATSTVPYSTPGNGSASGSITYAARSAVCASTLLTILSDRPVLQFLVEHLASLPVLPEERAGNLIIRAGRLRSSCANNVRTLLRGSGQKRPGVPVSPALPLCSRSPVRIGEHRRILKDEVMQMTYLFRVAAVSILLGAAGHLAFADRLAAGGSGETEDRCSPPSHTWYTGLPGYGCTSAHDFTRWWDEDEGEYKYKYCGGD